MINDAKIGILAPTDWELSHLAMAGKQREYVNLEIRYSRQIQELFPGYPRAEIDQAVWKKQIRYLETLIEDVAEGV